MADATNATPKKTRTHCTDAQIIEALQITRGMVYLAAERLSCDPSTIYRRIDKSARVKTVVDNARNRLLDKAEIALESAIGKEEAWAVCFALKTIGKHRGYIERQEFSGPEGGPIETKQVFNHEAAVASLAQRPAKDFDASGAD